MTLDAGIEHKKEHRKKYYGAKAIDKSCRNHGGDEWAAEDRQYKHKKCQASIDEQLQELDEYLDGEYGYEEYEE